MIKNRLFNLYLLSLDVSNCFCNLCYNAMYKEFLTLKVYLDE